MYTRFISTALLLLTIAIGNSQPERRNILAPQQVNKLVSLLHEKTDDVIRFKIHIRLAKYLLEGAMNGKEERDSVGFFISQAKELNARKFAGKKDGLILLYEAMLARESGKTDSAKLFLRPCINHLRSSNDNFPLAEAYFGL